LLLKTFSSHPNAHIISDLYRREQDELLSSSLKNFKKIIFHEAELYVLSDVLGKDLILIIIMNRFIAGLEV